MSGNKLGKISRKTVCDYVKYWRKGASNFSQKSLQRARRNEYKLNVKDVKDVNDVKTPQSRVENSVYVRNSPSSIIVKQNASSQKDAHFEKRFEYDLAALKLSKYNEMLRDYYTTQRLQQKEDQSYSKKLPELVSKLNDIMSRRVDISETEIQLRRNTFDKYQTVNGRKCIDFKPQGNCNVNRWHIKLPQRPEAGEMKETLPGDGLCRSKKPKKLIELPATVVKAPKQPIPSVPSVEEEVTEKEKPLENWQLGSVSIPRLDI